MRTDISKARLWGGRITGGIAVLFLTFDCAIKLVVIPPVTESMIHLGYPTALSRTLGVIETLCLVTYLVPRSAVFGALLMTGYLGGAVTSHLRVGDPLFTHILFPIYVAALLWGGLWLRDDRVRQLVPVRGHEV
jgi:hypothetical protein